jgi:hypothetical protein
MLRLRERRSSFDRATLRGLQVSVMTLIPENFAGRRAGIVLFATLIG